MIIANQSGKNTKGRFHAASKNYCSVTRKKRLPWGKIGITCRQPFLGADEWIEEEIKKSKGKNSRE